MRAKRLAGLLCILACTAGAWGRAALHLPLRPAASATTSSGDTHQRTRGLAASASPPPPPLDELPTGTWSDWYGPQAGPTTYGGICPCLTVLQKWFVTFDANPGAPGVLRISAECFDPFDGSTFQIYPVYSSEGTSLLTSPVSTTGFDIVNGTAGIRFLKSFMGLGDVGWNSSFAYRCPSGVVLGLDVAMGQAAGGAYAVTGLRFLCGDPSCGVADFLNMTASQPPADAAAPSPPLGDSAFIGDWSPWLGRSTPLTTIGICPCPGYIRGFSVWYEQGMQATANDTSPISGLTAQCSPGDGLPGASVEVFPGQGPPDASLNFTSGLKNVTVRLGQYLDSLMGVGGSGPTVMAFNCKQPGHLIAGLQVAWEPSPTQPGTAIATGVRLYCSGPKTCLFDLPAEESSLASPLPPNPSSPSRSPPPSPAPSPPSQPLGWSPWLGRATAESTMGICPCPGYIQAISFWTEPGLKATPEDVGPLAGITASCAAAAGIDSQLQVFPGQGPQDFNRTFMGGITNVTAAYGQFLDSFMGVGGRGTNNMTYSCLPGQVVTGLHVAWEPSPVAPFTNLATGLRVFCADPLTCAPVT